MALLFPLTRSARRQGIEIADAGANGLTCQWPKIAGYIRLKVKVLSDRPPHIQVGDTRYLARGTQSLIQTFCPGVGLRAVAYEDDLGGIESRQAGPQSGAPARKIRFVMRKESRHSGFVRVRRRWIEDHAQDFEEVIFLD